MNVGKLGELLLWVKVVVALGTNSDAPGFLPCIMKYDNTENSETH